MKKIFSRRYFLLLIAISSLSASASTVRGTVTDPLGALVANATVQLMESNKVVASGRTDAAGKYQLMNVQSGRFQVRVLAETFPQTESASFYVRSGETAIVDVSLRTPVRAEEIVVTATGVPTSEARTGASVTVLGPAAYLNKLDVLEPLRSVAGLQIVQTGQRGATTSLFVRGGNSDATKVLIDGVPANDIGGGFEFGDLSTSAFNSVEVFRGPNSILYGSDALAGVVSLTTSRGATPLPELNYSVDGGNFSTYRQEGTLGGSWRQLDYFSSLSRFDTNNSIPNDRFHNGTYAGNFGWSLSSANSFRLALRHVTTGLGLPNAVDIFGIPDNAQSADHDTFISATYENRAGPKWHNLVRYGAARLKTGFTKPSPASDPVDGIVLGLPVTLRGANGFTTSGQAFMESADCCPQDSVSTASRDSVYAQTDYALDRRLTGLLAYRYEAERGASVFSLPGGSFSNSVDRRNMSFIAEAHGDLWNRLFYSIGGAVEKNQVFGVEPTPRLSLAYYPFHPSSGMLRGTKLKANFGKGIKEPSVFEETSSLFNLLRSQPGGAQLIERFAIQPIGAVHSRSYEFGVEQTFAGHIAANINLFHNQFSDVIEFVSSNVLTELGVPPEVANSSGFGATINSSNYRARGVETEIIYSSGRGISARGGYTWLDAKVQRSFTDDAISPAINPLFPQVPIGAFSPLVGGRPFRRAPHTGFLAVDYKRSRWSALLQAAFVGRRDDSTFLLFSDANFGNTLLLPNRNLDSAYQKLDLSGDFRVNHSLTLYASMENLLNQRYQDGFGFPALPFTVRSGIKLSFGGEQWHRK